MRGALRRLLQRAHHHLFHLGVGDGARYSGARLVGQAVQPVAQEPGPPLGHGPAVHAHLRGHGDDAAALSACQHDPCPQGQPLRGRPTLDPALQRLPFRHGQQ